MPKTNIDLGYNFKDMVMSPSEVRDEKMYPTFHVVSDEKIDFPHAGEMTITFKKLSSETREGENGNRYECTIEVRKIVEMYPEKDTRPSKRDRTAEESLDALATKRMKEKEDRVNDY